MPPCSLATVGWLLHGWIGILDFWMEAETPADQANESAQFSQNQSDGQQATDVTLSNPATPIDPVAVSAATTVEHNLPPTTSEQNLPAPEGAPSEQCLQPAAQTEQGQPLSTSTQVEPMVPAVGSAGQISGPSEQSSPADPAPVGVVAAPLVGQTPPASAAEPNPDIPTPALASAIPSEQTAPPPECAAPAATDEKKATPRPPTRAELRQREAFGTAQPLDQFIKPSIHWSQRAKAQAQAQPAVTVRREPDPVPDTPPLQEVLSRRQTHTAHNLRPSQPHKCLCQRGEVGTRDESL